MVTSMYSIIHCIPPNKIPLSAHCPAFITLFSFSTPIFTFSFCLETAIFSYPQKEEGIITGKFWQPGFPLLLKDRESLAD